MHSTQPIHQWRRCARVGRLPASSQRVLWHLGGWTSRPVTAGRARPWGSCRAASSPLSRRGIHLAPFVMPPLIFTGLFVALWIWKCTMLVLFQNLIIYNPFLPPNARSLRIAEFARQCGGIAWREERMRSLDGTDLALVVADVASRATETLPGRPVYILYFQGTLHDEVAICARRGSLPDQEMPLPCLPDCRTCPGSSDSCRMRTSRYTTQWCA